MTASSGKSLCINPFQHFKRIHLYCPRPALWRTNSFKGTDQGPGSPDSAYRRNNVGSSISGTMPSLRQMELELKALEQNYSQLKELMEQMSKKAQGAG